MSRQSDKPLRNLALREMADQLSLTTAEMEVCVKVYLQLSSEVKKRYFYNPVSDEVREATTAVTDMLLEMTRNIYLERVNGNESDNGETRQVGINRRRGTSNNQSSSRRTGSLVHRSGDGLQAKEVQKDDNGSRASVPVQRYNVLATYHLLKDRFPKDLWTFCSSFCFSRIVNTVGRREIGVELASVHIKAMELHKAIENVTKYVLKRRKRGGGSHIIYVAESRDEREHRSGARGTLRQLAFRKLAELVTSALPYLYGQSFGPNGSPPLPRKLCTEGICELLGVSRKFLYNRTTTEIGQKREGPEMSSILDVSSVRLRQLRRVGKRDVYAPIDEVTSFECGCEEPCLRSASRERLKADYESFSALSMGESCQREEKKFLLNIMFCPMSNTTMKTFDRALSQVFTVSVGLISRVRHVLDLMCKRPSVNDRQVLAQGLDRVYSEPNHPMNRMPAEQREMIESHLDMMLRPDPEGLGALGICRVYSPEINTQEKLRGVLLRLLRDDSGRSVSISARTLQRRINEYLEKRNLRLVFTQSDHNACPVCKSGKHAILQYYYEVQEHKQALVQKQEELDNLKDASDDDRASKSSELAALRDVVALKQFKEEEAVSSLREHVSRDLNIRAYVKRLGDHFRRVENRYRERSRFETVAPSWNSLLDHAVITHQDDMTKVDLPCFVDNASADITRWRFDVNAHVSSVNNDAHVFSHEQGSGSKTCSTIMEEVILDHLIRSRGEAIKICVSDNAAVGKNWSFTIAFPQYLVDQGLDEIAVIIFLENNHGKWFADMLFGQLQTRRRRTAIASVDGLLSEFEKINKVSGAVRGFALNPLTSVDFVEVLASLGYSTKPPKDFGFKNRNIHFAAACTPRGRAKVLADPELRSLLGNMLPEKTGMVRVRTLPTFDCVQDELPYELRYLDVPATEAQRDRPVSFAEESRSFLVVPEDLGDSPSGSGVVSTRTAKHVGFNGLFFRAKQKEFPELQGSSSELVCKAWPPGLRASSQEKLALASLNGISESQRCAPENWVMRRPVSYFGNTPQTWKSRYPPRNLLNATVQKGPREAGLWYPTATYKEPPFPQMPNTCAFAASQDLEEQFPNSSASLSVLDVLRSVFTCMGDHGEEAVVDRWLQKPATRPDSEALRRYNQEVSLSREREKGAPQAARTVKQIYKRDDAVREQAKQRLWGKGKTQPTPSELSKELDLMFAESELIPGLLDKYSARAEADQERYASEWKPFKARKKDFDLSHDLLPYPRIRPQCFAELMLIFVLEISMGPVLALPL